MDLGAFLQIGSLGYIARANGIDIPRLRGYRLMSECEPCTKETMDSLKKEAAIEIVERLCAAQPFWNPKPELWSFDDWTDCLKDYYLVKGRDGGYVNVCWFRIHGWKRRILKFEIKKKYRKIEANRDMWNKYAGQENVLYIHSRIGSDYFKKEREEIKKQPWFLDMIHDDFDSTYVDIYARVDMNACLSEEKTDVGDMNAK